MHISLEGSPTEIEPVADRMCVLYDARDGRIAHYHRVITLRGGEESSRTEIEKNSLRDGAATTRCRNSTPLAPASSADRSVRQSEGKRLSHQSALADR